MNENNSPGNLLYEQLVSERLKFYSALKAGKDFTQLRPIRKRISDLEKEMMASKNKKIIELLISDARQTGSPV